MAGFLAGDPSHHGMVESGYGFTQDRPEEGSHWYLSRREIEENSSSRKDGIDLKKETYLRKSYCTFLQDLGMRLKVPQVTIATAIIFCHRFFLCQSHAKNDRRTIATVCMFLAGKVEETPRPLKDVILVSYEIIHKKDPAAVQRIKQKEVYEEQKELILVGERSVLATLGFDLNVHHPYKPLVEAIKKFKVAQNALAQVAWNFVNDGLRTSLGLQFKPHHIAAGAIFLAAKFLKVKLPSDGEKVWRQEFDVTPRQLEEVSNQMLELYEQNRIPPLQGTTESEGNTGGGGTNHRAPSKSAAPNEELVLANGGASTVKSGTHPPADQTYADNQGGPQRSIQNRSKDRGSVDTRTVTSDYNVGGDEPLPYGRVSEKAGEALKRSKFEEDKERNGERSDITEAGEWKSDTISVQNLDAIKKLDKDKVKAALERRKKFRGDNTAPKKNFMDEDDLIERELEDGVEFAIERHRPPSKRPESEYVEEGEVPLFNAGSDSPKLSIRKRKAWSPPSEMPEVKKRHNYTQGYAENGNRMGHHGYAERDQKRNILENRF